MSDINDVLNGWVALILAAHRFHGAARVDTATGGQVVTCSCGWSTVRAWRDPVGSRHTHEQHVAEALSAQAVCLEADEGALGALVKWATALRMDTPEDQAIADRYVEVLRRVSHSVAELEAENARLTRECDSARHELLIAHTALGDLRAGVLVFLDTYRPDLPRRVEQDLWALLGGTQ